MKFTDFKQRRIEDMSPDFFDWILDKILGWDADTRDEVYVLDIWPDDANRTAILAFEIEEVPQAYYMDMVFIRQSLRQDFTSVKIYVREE
jgi:hypothetical protein